MKPCSSLTVTPCGDFRDAEVEDAQTLDRERILLSAILENAVGLANYFDVLEAQQQLYPAQSVLAQIRRDRLLSHVRLHKALGGGWSLTDAQWQDPGPEAGDGQVKLEHR